PVVMLAGKLSGVGTGNSVKVPLVVRRPILFTADSVNHIAPSGPAVMPKDWLLAVGIGNSVIVPPCVMRAILFASTSTNQTLPSGPAVMLKSPLLVVGIEDSLILTLLDQADACRTGADRVRASTE